MSMSFLYHIFSRFCMFCALLTSRYQVSVYRTNVPLVQITLISVFLGGRVSSGSRRGWGSCSCGQCRDRGRCGSCRCSSGNLSMSFSEEIHLQAYCKYSFYYYSVSCISVLFHAKSSSQFMTKECTLSTGKLHPGGLPRNIVIWITDRPDMTSAVYLGRTALNTTTYSMHCCLSLKSS